MEGKKKVRKKVNEKKNEDLLCIYTNSAEGMQTSNTASRCGLIRILTCSRIAASQSLSIEIKLFCEDDLICKNGRNEVII